MVHVLRFFVCFIDAVRRSLKMLEIVKVVRAVFFLYFEILFLKVELQLSTI